MVTWQVTATTIYCAAVDDEVTLLVYRDGSARCTGSDKYAGPKRQTAGLLKQKSRKLKRSLACPGKACLKATEYRDKLFAEEGKSVGD